MVCPDVKIVCKCKHSFSKFKKNDCDLFNEPHSGRPDILNNELLTASVGADSHECIRDLTKKHSALCSTKHGSHIYFSVPYEFYKRQTIKNIYAVY